MEHEIGEIAERLRAAKGVVVLTGAGVSAESGIRTFRDTMEGLWKEFDPATLATPEAFEKDPGLVSRWYDHRRVGCLGAEPNAGHVALAELEALIAKPREANLKFEISEKEDAPPRRFTLLTQNVDRLHQRAGSVNVVELHGSIIEWRCTKTGEKVVPGQGPMAEFPVRTRGGGLLRPDVVWFGEMLPEAALRAAEEAVAGCDVFISVGTSSVVYPAAGYVRMAKLRGAFTAEVNRDETGVSGFVDVSVRGRSGEVLPLVVKGMRE